MSLEAQVNSTPAGTVASGGLLKITLVLTGVLITCLLIELRVLPALRVSTLALTVASAGFLLVKGRRNADMLNPVRILGALWCFCLALGSMRLLPTVSDWDSFMWSCVLTGLLSFIGGFWLARRAVDRTAKLRPEPGTVSAEHFLPDRETLIVAGFCLLVGTSVLAYEDFLIGGIPILSDNPDWLRMQLFGILADPRLDATWIKLIHLFTEFVKYGAFLAFIVLFQKRPKSRKVVLFSVLVILFGTLAYSSQAGRQFVVMIAVTGAVLFHYLRRRIRLVELGAVVIALFLFIGVFGSIRINESNSAPLFEQALSNSRFPQGKFWEGVAFGYATVTVSFEVFYRFTQDLRTMRHPPSGFLFYALHRFIPRASLGEVAEDLYSGESTTSTFLGEFYGDYGYWGVLFGPFVMGLFYGWAYSRGGGENSMYWIYVRALLVQMVVFFPYVNLFSDYVTWIVDLFFMYWLLRYVGRPRAYRHEFRASSSGLDDLARES